MHFGWAGRAVALGLVLAAIAAIGTLVVVEPSWWKTTLLVFAGVVGVGAVAAFIASFAPQRRQFPNLRIHVCKCAVGVNPAWQLIGLRVTNREDRDVSLSVRLHDVFDNVDHVRSWFTQLDAHRAVGADFSPLSPTFTVPSGTTLEGDLIFDNTPPVPESAESTLELFEGLCGMRVMIPARALFVHETSQLTAEPWAF